MEGELKVGTWVVQPKLNTLTCDGKTAHIEPKAMQVLVCLARRAPEVVTKEELIQSVWAGTFVTDDVLTRCISELRKAFEDDPKDSRVIQTIPKSGYRLIAPVSSAQFAEPSVAVSRPRARLVWIGAFTLGVLVVLLLGTLLARRLLIRGSTEPIQSLAVLPLENLSRDPEQEYFVDGMTEELISSLAKISALRVISRTSVMTYKGKRKRLPEIARELNVDAVVEGSVQRFGERVRISAQLSHAKTDQLLWAEGYERDLRDVLALQQEIAGAIAKEIRIRLTPQEQARLAGARPVNLEAYEAYLKGRYFWARQPGKGVEYFQKALDREPNYAPAYAGLADSYTLLLNFSRLAPKDGFPKAKAAALKALELDPGSAEAHTSLARVLFWYEWDPKAAKKEFQRAIELNPNYARAHQWYAEVLHLTGRLEEGRGELLRARAIDPLDLQINTNLAWLFIQARLYDQAIEQCRRTLELDANYGSAHFALGRAFMYKRMYPEAIAAHQRAVALTGGGPPGLLALGRLMHMQAREERQRRY